MLKYQFLIFYREDDALLGLLKEAGVVHIRRVRRDEDETALELKRRKSLLRQWRTQFERAVPQQETEDVPVLDEFRLEQLPDLLQELADIRKRLLRLEEERYHYRFFGEYDNNKLAELEQAGLHFHLFSTGLQRIRPEWKDEFALEHLFDTGRKSYFVVLSPEAQPPVIKAQPELFPQRSVAELEAEIEGLQERRQRIVQTFVVLAQSIRHYLDREQVRTEDQLQDHLAQSQMVSMGFGKVIYLQGWIPEDRSEALEKLLDAEGIYYERERPVPADGPPILLQNNRGVKLFEPIARLFDMPDYAELDLTPFFAPFFLLFFGLCLGDGGYGLLMLLVLLAFRSKVPDEYRGLWKLALLLETGAVFMGLLSGTFFGINLLETPVPMLSSLRAYMLNADQLFNLALALGAVQILFGLSLKAINQTRQYGIAYAIAPVGWMLLLLGLGLGYGLGFSLPWQVLSGLGAGLVLFFSDPSAGLATRLGKGLWDLYGITGFFGDLLSYIRLFALGLAGSILGFVVNDIALSMLPINAVLGPVLFVIMLLIGHGLNIFIASLGAFVHPMRLTFVEFYKNAGFKGGGEPFRPLRHLADPVSHPSPTPTTES